MASRLAHSYMAAQQFAAALLEENHVPPQRYGTAFHLTSPWQDVREINPFLASHSFNVASFDALGQEEKDSIFTTITGADPYLLWLIAHIDTVPARIVRVEEGQTMQLNVEGSELMWVFLAKDAKLLIEQNIVSEELALPRTFVWQKAGSEFTYWGLRAENTFLSERLQVQLLGEGAAAHVRHLTYGGKPASHPGGIQITGHPPGSNAGQADIEVSAFHMARQTMSDLVVRSAAADRHVAMYRGLIDIAENAGGSKGYQSGRALLLSRTAVVDNLPELAIKTNDVQCSHGVTTTHIDDEALFYMRSRGLSQNAARGLALTGFYHDKLEIPPLLAQDLEVRIKE